MPGPWDDFAQPTAAAPASGGPWEDFAEPRHDTSAPDDPLTRKVTRAEDLPSDAEMQAAHDRHVSAALNDPTGIIGTTLLGTPGGLQRGAPATHGGQPVTARDIPKQAPLPGTPASRLKEAINTPAIPFSRLAPDHPTTVLGGIAKGAANVAEGLTTPENVLLLAGTEGLGILAKPAAGVLKYLPRAVSAVFTAQMFKGAYDQIPEVKDAIAKKDYPRAAQAITQAATSAGMGGLAALHATGLHGAPVSRETPPVENVPEAGPQAGEQTGAVPGAVAQQPGVKQPVTPEQIQTLGEIDKILAPIEAQPGAMPETAPSAGALPLPQPAAQDVQPTSAQDVQPSSAIKSPQLPEQPQAAAEPQSAGPAETPQPEPAQVETKPTEPEPIAPAGETKLPESGAEPAGPWDDFKQPAPTGWGAVEGVPHEPHPSLSLSDAELKKRAQNEPLPFPAKAELGGRVREAWDTVSRLMPETAAKVTAIEPLLENSPHNATVNPQTGVLRVKPGVTDETMWHELVHLDQPEAIKGRNELTPDAFNSLEAATRDPRAKPLLDKFNQMGPKPWEEFRPEPGSVANVPTKDLSVDAARFQFKQRATGKAGITDEFSEVKKFDPEKSGILSVWHDPADGKTYVVNGHHRFEMADRLGHPELAVRYIDAANAADARTRGAMINIAEGRGDALDAAKVFRDSGFTSKELEAEGISLKGEKARQGLALSKLDPYIFRKVVDGDLPVERAAIIGEGLDNPNDQRQLYDRIQERPKLTNGQIEEMVRLANADTAKTTETQNSLFGSEEMTRSLIAEKAEVSDYIRKRLGQEKKLFAAVGNEGAAAKLGEAGNKIAAGKNALVAEETGQAQELYDKLSTSSGPISEELNNAATLLANGETSRDVKERAYKTIKGALVDQARKLSGEPARGNERAQGGAPGGRGEVGARKPNNPGQLRRLSEVVRDTAGGIKPGALAKAIRERRDQANNRSLFDTEEEDTSRKANEAHENKVTKDALTAQLAAPMSAEEQSRNLKARQIVQEGLFEKAPEVKQKSLFDVLNDTSGAFKPSFVKQVAKGVVDEITHGFDEMKALKNKRDIAMKALEDAKTKPDDARFGQKVIEAYTGERDLWEARVNQAIEKLRRIVPDHVDQEALAIMRDFKNKPEELKAWYDGTHGSLDQLGTGEREAAERNLLRLRPAIERAMDPTPAMEAADKVLTRISSATLKEGQKLGFLESRWTPDEYVPHILHPKGEGEIPKGVGDRVGRLMGGKIGRYFSFAETRQFPTLLDAIANNVKPKTLNALDAFTIHGDKFATARATHLLVNQIHDAGVGVVESDRSKWPEGWRELAAHSPEFRHVTVGSPEEKVNAFGTELTKPGEQLRGALVVPKFIDEALRPITDPDFMGFLPGFRKARVFQAYTKSIQLGLSFFHATTENYMALANMGPKGWAAALAADRTTVPFLQAERDFIAHGGTSPIQGRTVEAYKSLQPGSIPRWSDIWRAAPGVKQMDAAAQHITDFTFGNLQRKFKVTDYQLHRAGWMAKHPDATPEELSTASSSIAKEINAVYGGLHWENLGISKASTELARAVMLAPDWTFSNIFNVKYATEKGTPAGQLARAFWIRQLVGGVAATQLASLMFSGKPSKNLTQVYLGKDPKGKDIYQNIFFKGVSGDVLNLAHNVSDYGAVQGIARTLAGKAAPLPRAAMQLISNRDYFGREIVPKGMNPLAGTARAALETGKTLLPAPLSIENAYEMIAGKHAKDYTIPEFFTTPFAGNPPRHVNPNAEDRNANRAKRSLLDQIESGKVYKAKRR